jgi:hypothetical protein
MLFADKIFIFKRQPLMFVLDVGSVIMSRLFWYITSLFISLSLVGFEKPRTSGEEVKLPSWRESSISIGASKVQLRQTAINVAPFNVSVQWPDSRRRVLIANIGIDQWPYDPRSYYLDSTRVSYDPAVWSYIGAESLVYFYGLDAYPLNFLSTPVPIQPCLGVGKFILDKSYLGGTNGLYVSIGLKVLIGSRLSIKYEARGLATSPSIHNIGGKISQQLLTMGIHLNKF